MSLQTAPGREVRRMLQAQGQHAWVALTQRYGKTFRFSGMVITCEPEAVRALLMERAHAEKRPAAHRFLGWLPGVNGILFMDGEPWLKRTRAVMPVFHQRNIDAYPASLRAATVSHAAQWEQQGRAADLYDAVQQLGAASILRMGYGLDPADPLAVELGRALVDYKQFTMTPDSGYRFDDFGVAPSKLLRLPRLLLTLSQMRQKAARVRRAVEAIVAAGHTHNEQPDWIRQLADAGLGGRELADEINHLYGAYNAIDYVVAATLYELASDHRLAAVIRGEIVSALGDREPPSREDLPQLPWTNAFMLEIFRRYPVTMAAVRMTGKPMVLGGETLAAGTQVGILLHALHHHPDFWDSPNELRPGRWLESPAPKVPYSYVPFLDGSRKCIGRAMAEMVWLVVVSTIVRRFDLRVFGEAIVPPFMVPRFARPIPFTLERPAAGA